MMNILSEIRYEYIYKNYVIKETLKLMERMIKKYDFELIHEDILKMTKKDVFAMSISEVETHAILIDKMYNFYYENVPKLVDAEYDDLISVKKLERLKKLERIIKDEK